MVNSLNLFILTIDKRILFIIIVLLGVMFPNIAFADGGQSSGIDSILRSGSLDGDDSYRATIAGYMHKPISWIITIAGFLIITFSFMKVVLTLLYLTFPDMFDKIDSFKKQATGGGFKNKSPIDMISYVFSLFLPNVKSLTDYSDDNSGLDVTPLDYLKKKLPMVIFYIIIGAMIYDGKANSFMAKAADVGMFFGNMVEEHDTVGAVQNFVGRAGRWEFTYDTSTQEGKNKQKIAKEIQKHLHGLNPEINDPEHNKAVGTLSESLTNDVWTQITTAAKKKNIDAKDIVSFSINVTGRPNAATGSASAGSGVWYKELTGANAKTVLDDSKNKYIVVRYGQIRDKYNRNALFEAPDQSR